MRQLRRPNPLSRHLVALVLAAMIPFFIFSAFMVGRLVSLERQASERHLRREVQKLRFSVDQELITTIRALQALSASVKLQRHDLKSFHLDLKRVQNAQPAWETIVVQDADGDLLLSSVREFGAKLMNPPERDSLARLIRTGHPTIGPVLQSPQDSVFAGRHVFAVRVPVFEEARLTYILSAVLSVDRLQALIQDPMPQEWTRSIVDSQGTVAARSRNPQKFVGKPATAAFLKIISENDEGVVRTPTLEGKDVLVIYEKSGYSQWVSSLAVPIAVLEESARQSMLLVLTVGSLLLLFFGGLTGYYSRRLARGIRSAATGAMALADGKVPQVEKSMVTEVEQLRRSLLTVANLLQQRERERSEHLQEAQAARAEAEQANRAKSEFLANMSHELRTPLGVVLGFAELMAVDDMDATEKGHNLEIILRNGEHLLRLIDDILDLSKVEARRLTIESVDFSLPELLAGVIADLQPQAAAKSIELTLTPMGPLPEMIHTDPVRLRQIIYNIVGNGIKFTQKGQVNVEVEMEEAFLVLTIRDTGIGLSEEQQKLLFQPFTQADGGHTRRYGGTGLGLALCKRLAELLEGDVKLLESHPGQGSVFQVRLKVKG